MTIYGLVQQEPRCSLRKINRFILELRKKQSTNNYYIASQVLKQRFLAHKEIHICICSLEMYIPTL